MGTWFSSMKAQQKYMYQQQAYFIQPSLSSLFSLELSDIILFKARTYIGVLFLLNGSTRGYSQATIGSEALHVYCAQSKYVSQFHPTRNSSDQQPNSALSNEVS